MNTTPKHTAEQTNAAFIRTNLDKVRYELTRTIPNGTGRHRADD